MANYTNTGKINGGIRNCNSSSSNNGNNYNPSIGSHGCGTGRNDGYSDGYGRRRSNVVCYTLKNLLCSNGGNKTQGYNKGQPSTFITNTNANSKNQDNAWVLESGASHRIPNDIGKLGFQYLTPFTSNQLHAAFLAKGTLWHDRLAHVSDNIVNKVLFS